MTLAICSSGTAFRLSLCSVCSYAEATVCTPFATCAKGSPCYILSVVLGVLKVLERQKAWQQRWRERHEREGTLYDAVAVVEDVIIGRWVVIQPAYEEDTNR